MEITFAGQPAPRPGVIPPQVSSTEGYDPRFPGAVGYSDDISMSRSISCGFLSDTLPRNVYLYFLFTMPLLYASRVDEILEGVEETKPEVQRRAAALGSNTGPSLYHSAFYSSEAISRLLKSWDFFVGSLVQEWATLNIVSVLLSSAIITTLQLDGAVTDPYTRYFALLALVCSLMSILYGCIYIIRFNTLRRSRKIMGWSKRVQKTEESIWWNVRILLAMPVIWFSWSFLFYLVCVMTFVWRTGTTSDPKLQLTPLAALGPRLVITLTLVLGLIYLCLVIYEFSQYSKAEVDGWNDTLDGRDSFYYPSMSTRPVSSGGGGHRPPQTDAHFESGKGSNPFPDAAQASYAQPQTDYSHPAPYGGSYSYHYPFPYGQPIAPNPWFNADRAAANHAIYKEWPSNTDPERRRRRRGGV